MIRIVVATTAGIAFGAAPRQTLEVLISGTTTLVDPVMTAGLALIALGAVALLAVRLLDRDEQHAGVRGRWSR